jgi:hypothetical protein
MDKDQIEKIKSELFFTDGVIEISNSEGYRYQNGKSMFGTRVGPKHSISDGLLHEISHAVELKDLNRLHHFGFGLEITTKIEVLGKIYYEPTTWNATKLEARVILWQEVLCEIFGYTFDREEFAKALQYMPDFWCVPVKGFKFNGEKYASNTGKILSGDLKQKDNLRFQSIWDYMTTEKKTGKYTYSEFKRRWNKVLGFLNK